MKKSLLAFSTLIILSILFYPQAEVISMSTGSPGGMSGAPGDNSCVQCHNSFGLNTGSAIVNITSNIPITGYVPGNTYTITASAAQTGISKYGFEVHEALGSILVTNSTTTKHVGVGSNRITHEAAGTTVLVNSISWSFDWVAPPVGSGNATFYGAFVAADYPSGNSNDNVYTTNLIVSEFTSVLGCTDTLACNYNTLATVDDSSCVYEAISTVITEICLGDSVLVGSSVYTVAGTYTDVLIAANTCDSIITTTVTIGLSGCTDSLAINYNVSATCDDGNCNYSLVYENLFFSEWSEGSFNNKYFEIFNPTNDTISLVNYAFARVSNSPTIIGVYEYWNNFDSGSVILPMDVFIVAHPSADSLILAQANMTFGSLSNGNDGIALVYGNEPVSPMAPDGVTYEIVDWLGDWNGDPGQGWTIGGTFAGTRNHTIIRKCNIANGDTSWTNSAANQWMVLPNDYWNNIGYHTFNTSVYDSLSFTICNGLSIAVGSNIYDSTGVYTDVLVAANGCDSVVVTDLTVLTSVASVVVNNLTICDGDSILVDSNYYYASGIYIDSLQNVAGCDSIITTHLTVQTPVHQNFTLCNGDSLIVGSHIYDTPGQYVDTFVANNSCDSVVFTILDFHQSLSLQIGSAPSPAEICLGDTILLEASPGFVSYAWTNGMTGQIIYDTPTTDTWYMVEAVDTNGCVVKEDINVNVDTCITGVNEISITNELKVYPNPASDRVIIEITLVGRQEIVQLQVINNLGQIIETHQATSRQELSIDISHLPSGTYLLNLAEINGNTIATQKLTKE